MIIWMTGLSGAGKTTLADNVATHFRSTRLDGDVLRGGLCSDLGFSETDRVENNRRAAEVARLISMQGGLVIASFIAPTAELRARTFEVFLRQPQQMAKLVYVQCSIDTCRKRDVKGLYAKADSGLIPDFTGVSAPFDVPRDPDAVINTESTLDLCTSALVSAIRRWQLER